MSLVKGIKENFGAKFSKLFYENIDNFLFYGGLDVESLMFYLGVPEDDIPYNWICEHYGKEAADLINEILKYEVEHEGEVLYDIYNIDKNKNDYEEISELLKGEDKELIDVAAALFTIAKSKLKDENIN